NFHSGPFLEELEQTDAHKRTELVTISGEIEEALLRESSREANRIAQRERLAILLEHSTYGHGIRHAESALYRVVHVKAHVARIGNGAFHAPVAFERIIDICGRPKRLRNRKLLAFD